LLVDEDRRKIDESDNFAKHAFLVKEGNFLVRGHWNLVGEVSRDPRVLERAHCVIPTAAWIAAQFEEKVLSQRTELVTKIPVDWSAFDLVQFLKYQVKLFSLCVVRVFSFAH
jgi:hypothetical protein